ncbi:PREDICTED: TBC1 domain family member 7-like [Rhagoletis zephyria]|uniref:TBC1 domain family member 7-like n=1 Tax=Rhagoletis zephyria TaxID=28612 RepID=UPI0008117236|nr:PREDICTED: TBC1 domain family member 7-like [Rhagoletis zephyria]XP_017486006.1 PREDICTED: TBC1 domain family member 7-like [Rhagoletis zephyria]
MDERNFRSSYYEKVGCYSVEEKKSLNKLLQDNIRNHSKLKQFCLSYTVPTAQRGLLWSIILGILPLHKNSMDYILEQRTAVYDDLLRAVTMMQYIDQTTTKSKVLQTMWLLENGRLLHPLIGPPEDDSNFMEIVKVLLQIFDNDVETYWIAKEFFACSKGIEQECSKLMELSQTLLKREDIELHNHLERLGVYNTGELVEKWYVTCFAGVITDTALVKVWDKICGGSRKIVVFVFLELVKTLRKHVLNCNSLLELKTLIEQVKDQDATIVNKAIKTWQSNKNHNEITVH